jgi:3-hydroxypropanoate dehydrogenase
MSTSATAALAPTQRPALDASQLAALFDEGRSFSGWSSTPVDDATLTRLYELARLAPTALNSVPLRVLYIKSPEARARLLPGVSEMNHQKVSEAPVTAILAFDTRFYDELPRQFPMKDMRGYFAGMPEAAREAFARQNANIQAGFFIAAARALGLDCGPMGGFDAAKLDAEFFADGHWKSLLLVNLGHGDRARLHPRLPRPTAEQAIRIA